MIESDPPRLRRPDLRALRDIADAGNGLKLRPGPGVLCDAAPVQIASFRILACRGLVNVIDGYIVATEAGRELLDREAWAAAKAKGRPIAGAALPSS
ncbi:MAG TPA: hypothetical protein VGH03_14240 [Caulobacteraceae bacterium]